MTQHRPSRGRVVMGDRRLRAVLVAVVVATAAALSAASAVATSGGAALGTRPKTPAPSRQSSAPVNPFASRGMWIWYVSRSSGGTPRSIVAMARQNKITTVFVKAGDGINTWSQFNSLLAYDFHVNHIRVCAWQYVYGTHPVVEAQVAAAAVRAGADCLAIDAESEYEGKYISAQTYLKTLRKLVGANFPVGLAGFPYIDYHPGFPYSVFLGPGGAQYNAPQMYWHDIGTTPDAVYSHTYEFNRIYQRPINPIGQTSGSPPLVEIRRFRALLGAYGGGISWWDWQDSTAAEWGALAGPGYSLPGYATDTKYATLGLHAQGDLVVWAQEHLVKAGQPLTIDGGFGPQTLAAVQNFQLGHSLAVTGLIDTLTWKALLRYPPVTVTWTNTGAHTAAAARAGARPVPKSARLRARRYEIGRSPGRG